MTTQNKNVPALRFPEFSEDLTASNLGQVANFTKGKGISKSDIDENGKFECIRYGELYTHYGETIQNIRSKTNIGENELVFSEHNDVIIPASGETQIDIATASCILKSGVALGGDLNIIKTKLSGVFLSYYLNNRKKKDIASLAQGSSVVHLYANQLKTLQLNLPTLPEQQKIAAFLTTVDEKIQQLAKKKDLLEQYKKSVIQKIFNQEIRFKDSDGNDFADWEEKKIEPFLKLYVERVKADTDIPILTSSRNGLFMQKDYFDDRELINEGEYGVVPRGYFTYRHMSDDSTFKFNINNLCDKGAVSKEYPVFTTQGMDSSFLQLKLNEGEEFMRFAIEQKRGGTRTRLYFNKLTQLVISMPSLPEQQKIAAFLSAIDDKINLTNRQLEKTKEYKKGLLQQMFV